MNISLLVFLASILTYGPSSTFSLISYSSLIRKHIMSDYMPDHPPDEKVLLNTTSFLEYVYSINTHHERYTAEVIFVFKWNDRRLAWDSKKFGNVTSVVLFSSSIWKPNFIHANSLRPLIRTKSSKVNVSSSGDTRWALKMHTISTCGLLLTNFPFDVQICSIEIAFKGHSRDEIKLSGKFRIKKENPLFRNGQWRPLAGLCFFGKNTLSYILQVKMSRNFLVYYIKYIIPSIVLAVLSLVGIYISPYSGEKVQFAFAVLINYVIYASNFAYALPGVFVYPLLSMFLIILMALTCVSVFFSVIVLNVYYQSYNSGSTVPSFIMAICKGLRYILFVGSDKTATVRAFQRMNTKSRWVERFRAQQKKSRITPMNLRKKLFSISSRIHSVIGRKRDTESEGPDEFLTEDTEMTNWNNPTDPRNELLSDAVQRQVQLESELLRLNDWVFVADVLDRLLFIAFAIGVFFTILILLVVRTARTNREDDGKYWYNCTTYKQKTSLFERLT